MKTIESIVRLHHYLKYYRKWVRSGKPVPPPDIVKHMAVREYAKKYGIRVFLETGTYLGHMVRAVRSDFEKIYSIELGEDLYERTKLKFSRYKHIRILQGDSSKVLPEVLKEIDESCLFWFDAHYSAGITAKGEKETPILEEVNWVFQHPIEDHVILIDDAREFRGENDYPRLEELRDLVLKKRRHYAFDVREDIIRIHKKI